MPLKQQTNYQLAFDRALEKVRQQNPKTLEALGAVGTGAGHWELPVLNAQFAIAVNEGRVVVSGGDTPRIEWQILALHYLSGEPPWPMPDRWLSFGDFPAARGYEPVYRGRVLGRLCGTVGRDRSTFIEAAQRIGGARVDWGDAGFRFTIFPKLPIILVWYAGDGELGPGASCLYPSNTLSLLPVEDMVVLSEQLIGRLQGKGWQRHA